MDDIEYKNNPQEDLAEGITKYLRESDEKYGMLYECILEMVKELRIEPGQWDVCKRRIACEWDI